MKNKSVWSIYKKKMYCPKLDKDIDTDVLIIGGGITGISTAYHLIDSGLNVCLVEKDTLCSGVTSRTTGKLTYLQEDIYSKLKKYHGFDKSKLYFDAQKDAIKIVCDIVEREKIECDLEKVRSYVFSNSNDDLSREISLLKDFGATLKETSTLPNKKRVNSAYYVNDTYVFNPIKYLYGLKDKCINSGFSFYENTKIVSIYKENNIFICKTGSNVIKAKYVILALHYPYFLFPLMMPLKGYIEKSYIGAFRVNKNYKFSSISVSKPTISTRYYEDSDKVFELYLTNSHNTCTYDDYKKNFDGVLSLKNNPDYLWSNKDIITNDSLPLIGFIDTDKTFLIGTGYNTWGMTNGSLAGKILADLVCEKENMYSSLFSPSRGINLGKVINFPVILGSNALSFIKSKIYKQKDWYSPSVRFEKRNGKNVGIYVDENKKEHIVYNLCPHLKCSLIFNETEKTWDCPCHGSRFDIDGHVIEGPSNYDIVYKE